MSCPPSSACPDSDRPGIDDWLRSDAHVDQLDELVADADATTSLLPLRRSHGVPARSPIDETRWSEFAHWLRRQHDDGVGVFVDGGSTAPNEILLAAADQALLVTATCYLSLRHATRSAVQPTGVILVDEPGRHMATRDVERCLGAPVVATVSIDPAIARAVDAGLLATRLPWAIGRELRKVAA